MGFYQSLLIFVAHQGINMPEKLDIIVADSQYLVRMGLRRILEQESGINLVAEVRNEEELMTQMVKKRPNLVIIDYDQPDFFSVGTIQKIATQHPAVEILIISSDRNREQIYQVLEHRVNSFLTKECQRSEILDAIQATARGEKYYCSNVLNYILEKSFSRDVACSPTPLTTREIEIVKLTANGLIAKEIAHQLSLSTHTIYTHRKNIMRKLGFSSTSELVLYAVQQGWLKTEESDSSNN